MISKLIKNITVKSRIVLVLIVVILVATVSVAWVRATQISNQMDELLEERLKGNANMTFGIFDTVGTYTWWLLDIVESHVQRRLSDDGYDLEWQLMNLLANMSHIELDVRFYENIAVFDAELNMIAVACTDGDLPDIFMFQEYFDEQLAGPWVSPVFESAVSGRLQFLFTQPVKNGDDLLAMVAVTGNTQMLEYFLRDFVQVYDSFINIADRSGVIFFSNRPEAYMGRHVEDLGVIEAFGEIPMDVIFEHNSALTGIDKIAYVTFDPSLNWTIVSFFDAHAVENITVLIFESLRFTVGGILVAAIIIVIIIYFSLKPLGALAASANEVSKGNMDVVFHVGRNDEIGQVAQAFSDAMKHVQASKIRAENASKAKSDFLSKMSHEIRTPMNAIIGMAELILRENLSETAKEQAVTIKQSGDHLLSIINDILDLSKVESGKLEIVKSDYLFHSVVQDVISIVKMRMANPEVRFAAYMQADILNSLHGDEVRVRQVLLNVLINALKYTVKGHFSLEIYGEIKSEDVYLLTMKIKDTGIGIKPENMEILFNEFSQFDLEKNRKVEGTGLGLAITNNILKLMDGNIEVKSVYGEGSEFIITLPQGYSEGISEIPIFTDKRVLLYCRTPLDIEYISRSLKDLEVSYETANDETDLRNRLMERTWDFIFAEADMAYAACDIIQTGELDTRVVMLSDSYDASYKARSGQDFTLLIMPAYFLSIANVLGGHNSDYFIENQNPEHFVAPDAKVLLVDDIETNLKVGSGLLKLYGITAQTCLNGKSAIEAVLTGDYDLVLMDHMMPEMDGIEAVKIIRSLGGYDDLPIIALTANAIVGAKEMFLNSGFNDFIPKPIELAKLTDTLSKWIPEEKKMKAELTLETESEETEIVINDVDVARGKLLSGGSTVDYLDTLTVFRNDGISKLTELANCLESDDLSLYTTYVHALKSAAANIGAGKLSEKAKALEAAGKSGDKDFINKNNDEFISDLKVLLENLRAVIEANTKETVGENRDESTMIELLIKLKDAARSFDMETIDELSAELKSFTMLPTEKSEARNDILQSVLSGKYKQAIAQIDELIG
ncbi:MAG: ATP-binding protein [Oscillospiraceae bacterium]|nr:ATP-binding protein [Oscillospiraceae bacterium]